MLVTDTAVILICCVKLWDSGYLDLRLANPERMCGVKVNEPSESGFDHHHLMASLGEAEKGLLKDADK